MLRTHPTDFLMSFLDSPRKIDPENVVHLLDSLRTGVAVNVGTQNLNRRFSEPEAGLTTLNEV